MPSARPAAGRRGSSSRHARRRSPRLGRLVLPILGGVIVAGAAGAVIAADPGAELPVATGVGGLPGVEDLRSAAADDASRQSRTTPPETPDVPEATPTTSPTAAPTATAPPPSVAVTPTSSPTPFFAPVEGCAATTPDADVANGRLGDDQLCDIGEGHQLRPDAAAAFVALDAAYRADTGDALIECVTDSYRSYEEQVDLKDRKPNLAARPGTSNHGFGVAVDLGCGAGSYSSDLYAWLDEYGAGFGWHNPSWARPNGSKPEPWHWEYEPGLLD